MSGLAGLLAGHTPAGVYRWHAAFDADELARTVAVAGWGCAHLDGVVESREEALAALGEVLEFPEHYGRNLDALWDCLRDVGPTLLLWDHWGVLAYADEPFTARLLGLLRERAADPERPAFGVLLRGDGPDLGLPWLD
ncbi:barstar family protein [Nocardioides sp. KR10-350]|uniref:barstar family protein n=1 Tax=Nocardioides cheoyonin TaxID=3156615 RepID=UPI0032B4F653